MTFWKLIYFLTECFIHCASGDLLKFDNATTVGPSSPAVDSVMGCLVNLCRKAELLHPRSTLLTVKEQQQALLLCLARRNKEVQFALHLIIDLVQFKCRYEQ